MVRGMQETVCFSVWPDHRVLKRKFRESNTLYIRGVDQLVSPGAIGGHRNDSFVNEHPPRHSLWGPLLLRATTDGWKTSSSLKEFVQYIESEKVSVHCFIA